MQHKNPRKGGGRGDAIVLRIKSKMCSCQHKSSYTDLQSWLSVEKFYTSSTKNSNGKVVENLKAGTYSYSLKIVCFLAPSLNL